MKLFSKPKKEIPFLEIAPILYLAGRLLLYLALFPSDLHGLGDFPNYFSIASLPGLPFINYWIEYPPVFAITLKTIQVISQGNQFVFDFILYFLLSIAGSICIFLFFKIAEFIIPKKEQIPVIGTLFFGFLSFLAYTWWYFDLILVCFMLLGAYYLLKDQNTQAGIWIGIGMLTKWFSFLLFPAILLFKKKKEFIKITIIACSIVLFFWGLLFLLSPENTLTSLRSQPARNSWETLWALIDGNYTTGAFIPLLNRLDSNSIQQEFGNPAKIPSWLTLIIFLGLGLFLMTKIKRVNKHNLLAFIGLTWMLFLLWSPGWSPQWILYLIPIVLLTFPASKGLFITFGISFISFLEWPVLLSRQLYAGLWIIVPLRTLLFIYLLVYWFKKSKDQIKCEKNLTNQ